MEKRVQILLGQEKRKLCGWVGALMGLFLLGFYLMFFFFGGGVLWKFTSKSKLFEKIYKDSN